ncbi:proline-rich transmembrane protein 1-like [Actinia tenebrosa]|uniref:Proline-rich transmembrane protein 1-like n=1 Tax=Actinia tenebrosa TaxID=6105 RepID=A0A6P8ILK9_ACTTE|nr:proline-rich transmembrane protein 1-like [Actinia tenebrosa]
MEEKQAQAAQLPPAYTEQPGYPQNPPPQQGYQPQPGGYAPQGQQGYAPQGQQGYAPQGQQGYPPQGQQGYAPQGQPGYPPQGYPPPAQPAYPYQTPYQPPPQPVMTSSVSNNVTIVQANAPQVVVAQVYPYDHCGLAWFACLCCFWPLGIVALINANNARDAINRDDIGNANYYSMMARKYANWSIGVGIIMIVVIIIISVIA